MALVKPAVIDTSVLLSLQSASLLAALPMLFGRVLVPMSVASELLAGEALNGEARRAVDELVLFEECLRVDAVVLSTLLQNRERKKAGADQGEAEAVAQAAELQDAMVLCDDALGRKWAFECNLECHGTVWIVERLHAVAYLRKIRPSFERMLAAGRRQPLIEINLLLQRCDEQPIEP